MLQAYSEIASAAQSFFDGLVYSTPPGKLAIETVGAIAALIICFFPIHQRGSEAAIAAIVLCFILALIEAW
jgi:hypothetical protein